MEQQKVKNIIESLLLAADKPLEVKFIETLFESDVDRPGRDQIMQALQSLTEDYQNRGIAKVLANALVANLKSYSVDTIYTLVNWNDWDLLQFFHAMGFSRGDMINLVLKV